VIEPISLLRLQDGQSSRVVHDGGADDRVEIANALKDAREIASAGGEIDWNGPLDHTGSVTLELQGWGEVSIDGLGTGTQFTFGIVAPRETCLSRSSLAMRDRRIPIERFQGLSAHETRAAIVEAVDEWIAICSKTFVVGWRDGHDEGLPVEFRQGLAKVAERMEAVTRIPVVRDAIGEGCDDLAWEIETKTSRTPGGLTLHVDVETSRTFDARTVEAVMGHLPETTLTVREGRTPLCLEMRPYVPPVGWLRATDVVSAMRTMRAMGIDWNPEMVTKEENRP
jgi:hypothetical protein